MLLIFSKALHASRLSVGRSGLLKICCDVPATISGDIDFAFPWAPYAGQ